MVRPEQAVGPRAAPPTGQRGGQSTSDDGAAAAATAASTTATAADAAAPGRTNFLDELTEAQRMAATLDAHLPLQMLAGPGSGKTRVLTTRVAWLVMHQKIAPEHIFVVTFTNKAANEMRRRLEMLIGLEPTSRLLLGTFHAMCARLLRRYGVLIGLEASFTILDADDSRRVVKECLKELDQPLKPHPHVKPEQVSQEISRAKAKFLDAEAYRASLLREEAESANRSALAFSKRSRGGSIEVRMYIAAIYERYEAKLLEFNALDFDDLLVRGLELVRDHQGVVSHLRHVLVDEFQDTNAAQYEIMVQLAHATTTRLLEMPRSMRQLPSDVAEPVGLSIVGDPDQSIYGWRSAEVANLSRMRAQFRGTREARLEENFRSTGEVLEASLKVVQQDEERIDKGLFTSHPRGSPVVLRRNALPPVESSFIATEIKRLIAHTNGKLSYDDFAILLRYNALSREVEQQLQQESIPSRMMGGSKFFDRAEIKDLLAYLQLADNPRLTPALLRVINVPKRGVGEKSVRDMELKIPSADDREARGNGDANSTGCLMDVVERIVRGEEPSFRGAVKKGLTDFLHVIDQIRKLERDGASVAQMLKVVLEEGGYHMHLKRMPDYDMRWENVKELINFAEILAQSGKSAAAAGQPPPGEEGGSTAEIDLESRRRDMAALLDTTMERRIMGERSMTTLQEALGPMGMTTMVGAGGGRRGEGGEWPGEQWDTDEDEPIEDDDDGMGDGLEFAQERKPRPGFISARQIKTTDDGQGQAQDRASLEVGAATPSDAAATQPPPVRQPVKGRIKAGEGSAAAASTNQGRRAAAEAATRASSSADAEVVREDRSAEQANRRKSESGPTRRSEGDARPNDGGIISDEDEKEEAAAAATEQLGTGETKSVLRNFLESSILSTDREAEDDKGSKVTIATIHAAKGLEYGVVFVVGVEEGILPFIKCTEPDEVAEERRLLYVAMTRAKALLYLTHCTQRSFAGETYGRVVSHFVERLIAVNRSARSVNGWPDGPSGTTAGGGFLHATSTVTPRLGAPDRKARPSYAFANDRPQLDETTRRDMARVLGWVIEDWPAFEGAVRSNVEKFERSSTARHIAKIDADASYEESIRSQSHRAAAVFGLYGASESSHDDYDASGPASWSSLQNRGENYVPRQQGNEPLLRQGGAYNAYRSDSFGGRSVSWGGGAGGFTSARSGFGGARAFTTGGGGGGMRDEKDTKWTFTVRDRGLGPSRPRGTGVQGPAALDSKVGLRSLQADAPSRKRRKHAMGEIGQGGSSGDDIEVVRVKRGPAAASGSSRPPSFAPPSHAPAAPARTSTPSFLLPFQMGSDENARGVMDEAEIREAQRRIDVKLEASSGHAAPRGRDLASSFQSTTQRDVKSLLDQLPPDDDSTEEKKGHATNVGLGGNDGGGDVGFSIVGAKLGGRLDTKPRNKTLGTGRRRKP